MLAIGVSVGRSSSTRTGMNFANRNDVEETNIVKIIKNNDVVIVYERHDSMKHFKVVYNGELQNKVSNMGRSVSDVSDLAFPSRI